MNFPTPSRTRRGFSLLELLLALALSAIVMAAIATSIHLYFFVLDDTSKQIEQTQLARSILRRIATDLRSAVQPYQPPEFEELSLSAGGAAGSLDSLGEDGLGGELSGENADDLLGDIEAETTEETVVAISGSGPSASPGLYGNLYEMQVDVSRVPRPDEYQIAAVDEYDPFSGGPVSDVKSIAYFMAGSQNAAGASAGTSASTSGGASPEATGLVRREMGRASALYAAENGAAADLNLAGRILAPEVVALEFRYFDGLQWLTEWDTQTVGGLPVAVEIAIALAPSSANDEQAASVLTLLSSSDSMSDTSEVQWYRMVVRLPAARVIPPSESEALMAEETLQ